MTRYARQMILPEIGTTGQARLAQAHVLVVGAGGLGCPTLQYLVGAGVGQITIVDPDHVEESNLHRQPLYKMADIGMAKVTAACTHLRAANPNIQLHPHICLLDPTNGQQLVKDCHLVIDAADSYAVSYTLSDICLANCTPLISASALGQSGYVGAFCGAAPSLRAVFPDLPEGGGTCASAGVMGPVVGMLGAMQAQIALQILLGFDPSPLGLMVSLDMKTLHFSRFSFADAKEPPDHFPFISLHDLTTTDKVIELRGYVEAPVSIHPTAKRLDLGALNHFPRSKHRTVLICRSGVRAWRAAKLLRKRGHENLALLAAGATQ